MYVVFKNVLFLFGIQSVEHRLHNEPINGDYYNVMYLIKAPMVILPFAILGFRVITYTLEYYCKCRNIGVQKIWPLYLKSGGIKYWQIFN